MGQQQILLLVVGIVIVAIATVVGLSAFGENRRKAAADELVTVGTRVASEATAWVLRHPTFGGGGNDPSGLSFDALGYETDADGDYLAGGGAYTLSADATSFVLRGEETTHQMHVVVAVFGPTSGCVVTESGAGAAPETPTMPGGCAGW
jgi:hypothetical protein